MSVPGTPRTAFVGRRSELHDLEAGLSELSAGRGALFFISGEPGIGKTRLADELAARAEAAGVQVHWGRCHELEGRPPFWPWQQILRGRLGAAAAEPARDDSRGGAAALGQLIPALRDAGGAQSRAELFEAVAAVLRGGTAPLLLILDDLHWADLPSLLLFDYLASELAEAPVLLIGTYREVEIRRQAEAEAVIARLLRHGRALPLAGLSADEASDFVAAATGQPQPAALLRRLHDETEGNPFFLDEVVRLFRGSGDWFTSSAGLPISQGVRGAIRQRLAPLAPPVRRALAAAAVVGREFDVPLLAGGTELRRSGLLDLLTPALELEVIAPLSGTPGRYRFAHALVRDTLYEEVAPGLRASLHRRFGELLEQRLEGPDDGRLAEVAHHYFAAAAGGGEEKASEYAERAGRQALQMLAYEEAAQQFARALQLSELSSRADPSRQCELLLALGEACNRAGAGEESSRAYRRAAALARQSGAPALLARAATGLSEVGSAWTEYGRSDEALVRLLEEALAALGDEPGALRARVMARLATELCWSATPQRAAPLSGDAVMLARQSGDRAGLAYALVARLHCLSDPDHVDERLALVDEVMALTGGRGDLAVDAYLWRLGDLLHLGRMPEVAACRAAMMRAVENLRQPAHLWMLKAVQGQAALLEGRLDDATACAETMLTYATHNAEQSASALLFLIQRERGRHRELAVALESLAYQHPGTTAWRAALALLYAESEQPDAARREMTALLGGGVAELHVDLAWLFCVACLAEACRVCGAAPEAAALYEAMRRYDGRNVVAGPLFYLGPVSYYLGLLAAAAGRGAAAAAHLQRALAETRAAGAPSWVARVERVRAALGGAATAPAPAVADDATAWNALLALEGDFWTLSYRGRTCRMKALKGFAYLTRLLEQPGREFHVLDLAAAEPFAPDADLGPLLDPRAKAEIGARLDALRAREAEAEANNDPECAGQARGEIERLAVELSRAVGLGGRDRRTGAAAERARASVTKALRAAIRQVARNDPALADVLARTVRTGTFCAYEPIAEVPIVWQLGGQRGAD